MNADDVPHDPDLSAIAALRVQLWDSGYRSLAVYSHNHADREHAGKKPLGDRWTERARQDPPECVRLPAVAWAANTGILADQLRAIDIDIDDPELAGTVRALALDMLGDTLIRCRANSGRCLLPYRAAEGSPRKRYCPGASVRSKCWVMASSSSAMAPIPLARRFTGIRIHPS